MAGNRNEMGLSEVWEDKDDTSSEEEIVALTTPKKRGRSGKHGWSKVWKLEGHRPRIVMGEGDGWVTLERHDSLEQARKRLDDIVGGAGVYGMFHDKARLRSPSGKLFGETRELTPR